MLSDDAGEDIVKDISLTESQILEIANTKVHWWNIIKIIKKVKALLGKFFVLVLDNFRSTQQLHKTNEDVVSILRMQQKQLDIINQKIDGESNGKSSDNYGS